MKLDDRTSWFSRSRTFTSIRSAPIRFVESTKMGGDVIARAIADEIRNLPELPRFKREDQLRVRMRLRASTRPRPHSRLRPVFIASLMFLLGGSVGAAIFRHVAPVWTGEDRTSQPVPAPRAPPSRHPRSTASRGPVSMAPVLAAPDKAVARSRESTARATRDTPRDPARIDGDGPSQVLTGGDVPGDQQLIANALLKLRHEHDPVAALRALDEYDRRYPGGVLAIEAALARVDALLALGRTRDALTALDGVSFFSGVLRAEELQTLRGELRAENDRCVGAVADFDVIIARARPDLRERALFGRAGCRARLGDDPGARADLDDYAARFPRGRFIDQVRRARTP